MHWYLGDVVVGNVTFSMFLLQFWMCNFLRSGLIYNIFIPLFIITNILQAVARGMHVSEWVSSFLTAHQHTLRYLVPYNSEKVLKMWRYNQAYLATINMK